MTTGDWSISLFFWMTPWTIRAIWSAPPPVPAGTMNSTVRVGSQASAAVAVNGPTPARQAKLTAWVDARSDAGMALLFCF